MTSNESEKSAHVLNQTEIEFFRRNGYIIRTDLLSKTEIDEFLSLFDRDRDQHKYRWHPYGYHQQANYDALVTTPDFDRVVRHPSILSAIGQLMGGPVCFGEIGARYMAPYAGDLHRSWHRDRPHWPDHPMRMDYIQLMIYLTHVTDHTHCFSLSPESIHEPVLADKEAQLRRGGITDIHGPVGTVCLFNVSVLHTATTRSALNDRKTLQIYYGHRDRPYLANDSVVPPRFWRDDADAEVRAFYGNLNEVTRIYHRAFGGE
ncbi:MAG: phytanoyl-CoA dioxygenase family protein [bacterium]|nr:phytanoyl-CoA dioxygenase family protein [bacterium]